MELLGISLARVVAFLEVPAADPAGGSSMPESIGKVAARYSFLKAPQALEEMNFEKGIEFSVGTLGSINIDKMTLFGNGIVVDTRSSTKDCAVVVQDFLDFVHESFGAVIQPTRQMTLSNIIFQSEMKLANVHPILAHIAELIAASVSRDFGQSVVVEPSALHIGADLSQIKLQPSAFTIERRADTPFSANTYFSAAPLGTEEHLKALSEVESALL
jgi:hypothetical protein